MCLEIENEILFLTLGGTGYIGVGDGYWRPNVLVTDSEC